jgi:hypothetical protein
MFYDTSCILLLPKALGNIVRLNLSPVGRLLIRSYVGYRCEWVAVNSISGSSPDPLTHLPTVIMNIILDGAPELGL